jgi:outer membrane protein TolC
VIGAVGWLAGMTAEARVDLDGCVAAALEANPDLQAARSRLDAARAALRETASAYYPQIGVSGNWARTDNPPQAFFMQLNQRQASLQKDFNQPDDTENQRGSAALQWRLMDGGRREADRRTARNTSESADHMLAAVRNDLVYQVNRAYYSVLKARAFVGVRTQEVASIEENLRVANERLKAGGAMRTDVLNLDVVLSQAREELIRARNGLSLAVAALNTAVGKDVLTDADVAGLDSGVKDIQPPSGLTHDIDGRPELRAAGSQSQAMDAVLDRARREYMPVLSAMGSLDWDSDDWGDFERSYFVGAVAELNLFDGFRTRSGVARARANASAARADQDKLRQALRFDLKQAVLGEQEAWERLGIAGKSMASAEEALRLTRERYRQGAADIAELMMAQVGLTATASRELAARYDYLLARSNVARACGEIGLAARQ